MDKIEVINYRQVVQHKGIKFWCYNAGHVLGAAMFMIEIAGVKVLHFTFRVVVFVCYP
jgi:cleavage and polyadenylation specificity factor subunit 3